MKKLTIVIPMAGEGSRFKEAGYSDPKPFINICGTPMIVKVIENILPESLADSCDVTLLCIVKPEHNHRLRTLVRKYLPYIQKVKFIVVDLNKKTSGAAVTLLSVEHIVDPGSPLLVANCDQLVVWSNLLGFREDQNAIFTFLDCSRNPKWSYLLPRNEDSNYVKLVKEKDPISSIATCGVYYWAVARDAFYSIYKMISYNDRFNGEFYIAPSFNYCDTETRYYMVDKMIGLGTPLDLENYINSIKA